MVNKVEEKKTYLGTLADFPVSKVPMDCYTVTRCATCKTSMSLVFHDSDKEKDNWQQQDKTLCWECCMSIALFYNRQKTEQTESMRDKTIPNYLRALNEVQKENNETNAACLNYDGLKQYFDTQTYRKILVNKFMKPTEK